MAFFLKRMVISMETGKRFTSDIVRGMSLKEREEALRKMQLKRISVKQLDSLNVGVYDEKGYLIGERKGGVY